MPCRFMTFLEKTRNCCGSSMIFVRCDNPESLVFKVRFVDKHCQPQFCTGYAEEAPPAPTPEPVIPQ